MFSEHRSCQTIFLNQELLMNPDGHVAVSSQGIQDHLGAKSANWLASCVVNLVFNFRNPDKAEPCNEVETFLKVGSCNRWLGGTVRYIVSEMFSQVRIRPVTVIFRGFFSFSR